MNSTKKTGYDACPICVEERRVISWVTCPKCQKACCRGCVKKFLLSRPDTTPICMSCKIPWSSEFISNNTDNTFYNTIYRNHCAKIIIDQERALLPGTQSYAVRIKQKTELKKQLKELSDEFLRLRKKKDYILDEIILLSREDIKEDEIKVDIKFIGNCPNPNCNGFLDSRYVCGICDEESCSHCRLQKHNGDCDKNTVETVKLITKDTKPCPNCKVPIFRIHGCDQMYCTKCHTPFSWKTGKIENGRIHNPHYYEFIRQNGIPEREPGDERCGGPTEISSIYNRLLKASLEPNVIDFILHTHRVAEHIRIHINDIRYRQNNNTRRDLRVNYINNIISEKEWFLRIKRVEKKRESDSAIILALTMFVDTLNDLHTNISLCEEKEIPTFILQIENLFVYIRNILKKIEYRFKITLPKYIFDFDGEL